MSNQLLLALMICPKSRLTSNTFQVALKPLSPTFRCVDRYCNVDTFEEHTVTDEYHTMTSFDIPGSYRYTSYSTPFRVGGMFFTEQETDKARTIFPREQPVITVDKVEANLTSWTGSQGAPQTWVELHERGKEWTDEHGEVHIGGDYDVISYFETSKVYLMGKLYPAEK